MKLIRITKLAIALCAISLGLTDARTPQTLAFSNFEQWPHIQSNRSAIN